MCTCFPQISFFSLLSVLCVMLSMAGSVLSCKNAQLARDFQDCSMVRLRREGRKELAGGGVRDTWVCPDLSLPSATQEGKVCVCCPSVPLLRPCPESGQELKLAPNSTCDEARGALKVIVHAAPQPFLLPHHLPGFHLCLPFQSPHRPELVGFSPPQAPFTSLFLSCFQNLLFSVCGLTICAAIICTLSAIVCCIQIFSLDLVHTVRGARVKAKQV